MATFLPTITSLVAYALVFKVLFNTDHGLINYIVEFFGGEKIQWVYSAWPARASIIISITWRWVGYNMIIILAGIHYDSSHQADSSVYNHYFYHRYASALRRAVHPDSGRTELCNYYSGRISL